MANENSVQASDEPMRAAFETWCGDARYQFVALQRMSGGRYVHPGVQADWEVWQASRAALKAQPAPTEDQGGKLLELFKHTLGALAAHDSAEAERIGKLYRGERSSGNSGELAQGEDSARLDAEVKRLRGVIDIALEGWNMSSELRKVLESGLWPAARATADTGSKPCQ